MKIAFAVFFLAMICSASAQSFCHHLNCPPFTVTETDGSDELRKYPLTWWVSTNVSSFDFNEATSTGFNRLFDYISGANSKSANIPMTTPVTTQVFPGAGPFCASTFVVSFFLPNQFQADGSAPLPTDPTVYISSIPARTLAVESFKGYANWDLIKTQATDLISWMSSQSLPFSPILTVAQYNSPFDIIDRHNEVWYEII